MWVTDKEGKNKYYITWVNDTGYDGTPCFYCETYTDASCSRKVDDFVVRVEDVEDINNEEEVRKYIATYYLGDEFKPESDFDGFPIVKQEIDKEGIADRYNKWVEKYGVAPNRVIVKMAWEDGDNTEKGWQKDVIALDSYEGEEYPADDEEVLFYAGEGYEGLTDLLREGNGSDFILIDIIDFYRV